MYSQRHFRHLIIKNMKKSDQMSIFAHLKIKVQFSYPKEKLSRHGSLSTEIFSFVEKNVFLFEKFEERDKERESLVILWWYKININFCETFAWLLRLEGKFKAGFSPSKKNFVYLLQWWPFKNDGKCFLFHLKSSFRSQDI